MKIKLIAVFILLSLLFAASCSEKNIGDESTVPLDRLIGGIIREDIRLYKSAFPPDYIKEVERVFGIIGNDIDALLAENIKSALQSHNVNYGDKLRIKYKLISKTALTEQQLAEFYWDLYAETYNLPLDSITEAYTATFEITVKGKEASETKRAEYRLLKINGEWYLHPQFFMYMFSI